MSKPGKNHEETGTDPPKDEEVPWVEQARKAQQVFLEILGNRLFDSYRRKLPSICHVLLTGYCKCLEGDGLCANDSEMIILRIKIGYALFGNPSENPSEKNCFTGYSKVQLKSIEKIFRHICQQPGDQVLMSTIYIILEKTGENSGVSQIPIFRVSNPTKKYAHEYCFIDHSGRLYINWNDFLENNKLPSSKCCYPKDGVYAGDCNGRVEICYGKTPAAEVSGVIVKSVDIAATVVSVGAGVGALFPPTALPCAAACGIVSLYSIVRGSVELADRGNHGQSLADREAGRHWLSLAGSVLGLGSAGGMAAIKHLAKGGKAVSDVARGTVTALNASSTVVNGVSIVENFITIHQEKEWDALQCFQFAVNVLFFAHSVANFKTASSVIEETQIKILDDHSASLSKRNRKLFHGIQKETMKGESPIIGRAKIIKDLNHLSNKSEFYSQIRRSNNAARKNLQPIQKVKFGGLMGAQEGPTFHGQTSTCQGLNIRPTAAYSAPDIFTSKSKFILHEPLLVTAIKDFLKSFLHDCDVNQFYKLLNEVCANFRYGRQCMMALRIVVDIYNCRSFHDASKIIYDVMDLWQCLVKARLNHQTNSSGSSTEQESNQDSPPRQLDIEEIMSELVEDVEFVPSHLSMESEEEVYHFPSDHRSWGENGELLPEDYVLIAQNTFGIANVQCCNIMHQGNTANVFFENFGFVTITSFKREQKVLVKKFRKLND